MPDCVASVFGQVISTPLGWSPLSSVLVIRSPSSDMRGPSVIFEAVDVPFPGPLHFSHSVDYFCPLPDPDVGPCVGFNITAFRYKLNLFIAIPLSHFSLKMFCFF